MSKRLYKSSDDAMIAGVCAGIAEYFNVDPTLIRLGFVLLMFMGGSGVLAYLVAAIVMPERPRDDRWQPTGEAGHYYDKTTVGGGSRHETSQASGPETPPGAGTKAKAVRSNNGQTLLAYILIGIGGYMLVSRHVNWHRLLRLLQPYWPALFIILGLILLAQSLDRR